MQGKATFSSGWFFSQIQMILHQRRFVSLFASNFCAFRSICSSTNSLPSSEYILQRDWAIIFIQIAYLMNRLHIETSTSGDPLCRCHKFLNRTNISWICFFESFGVQEKKLEKIAVSLFRSFGVSVFRLVMSVCVCYKTANEVLSIQILQEVENWSPHRFYDSWCSYLRWPRFL